MQSLIIPLIMTLINPDRRFPIRQSCPSLSALNFYGTAFLQSCPVPLVAALNTKQRAFPLLAATCLVVAYSCDINIRCHTIQVILKCSAYFLCKQCRSLAKICTFFFFFFFLQRWKPCLLAHFSQSCLKEKMLEIPIIKKYFHCLKEQITKKS